ncbi:DUF1702 family protein [Verrucosispora sp. WMMD573]|uniref:DUF1702 family protein n=1 Tax=Verrucosispora sp. WMMD573 TaxID=3015149 RepID=UPI00248B79BE|nr:DUF1702 family protein [Verrucosispora sp. WMMD573]WBB53767.1 DUF1702 family protein [Verrucosispora sp. WMMD573]
MAQVILALRQRILTPDKREALFDVRGFHAKNEAGRRSLESAGLSFIGGFGDAAGAPTPQAAEELLERRPAPLRGFAYEGAAMAYALIDGLRPGGGRGLARFLAGRGGAAHRYMVHVGAGWAMARLPRWRWKAVLPPDPLLRWLALDGYGFHQAYFHTDRYVHGRHRDPERTWPTELRHYAPHAVDQGIGRALWFVAGADPAALTRLLTTFAADRHADLWSGVGLAASYAGGADQADLTALHAAAGEHRPWLAQGSAFAAKARLRAGHVPAQTAGATAIFCGTTPERAATITDTALTDLTDSASLPAFAVWRQRIAEQLVPLGRC